jgi:beta-glucosidase-like glycosyl hydrolase
VSEHHYVPTIQESIKLSLEDGESDIDDGPTYQQKLHDTSESGFVNMTIIRRALFNAFRVRFRLGLFDPAADQPLLKLGAADINDADAQALNELASRQTLVLLQNFNSTLPFQLLGNAASTPASTGDSHGSSNTSDDNDSAVITTPTVAVIGPMGQSARALQGSYGESTYCTANYR